MEITPEEFEVSQQELYERDLAKLSHKPINGYPRPGFIGENVFAEFWEAFMLTPAERLWNDVVPFQIVRVIGGLPYQIEQRQASVAATFICWLGTNCGSSFLHQCQTIINEKGARVAWDRERVMIREWAWENSRQPGINHGYRIMEYLLSDPELHHKSPRGSLRQPPVLERWDAETIEHVVSWLASDEGQLFLRKAAREAAKRTHEWQQEQRTKHAALNQPKAKEQ